MYPRLYFGHPVNAYDTELEKSLLKTISDIFPQWHIENPNQKHHADGYKHYVDSGQRGMEYYYREVLPECHGGIFLPFRDGKFGAGVFGEAKFLADRKCPTWQITAAGIISKLDLRADLALSVAETKSYIRTLTGETKPY